MDSHKFSKNNYDDIINLPPHISSRHPHMSMIERAAQFSPFAAFTGYGDVIRETQRLTDRKPELSAEEKDALDDKLRMARALPGENPEIVITYFVPDEKKSGGAYLTASGRIKKIDSYEHRIILDNGTKIDIGDVVGIERGEDDRSL